VKIVHGRYAGQSATLHQFANGWMTVDLDDGRQCVVVRPDQVQLDPDEHARFIAAQHVGSFWREWRLNHDGTFTALHCPDHPGPLDDARGHVCRLRPMATRPNPSAGEAG
jgi:hypothetical protein